MEAAGFSTRWPRSSSQHCSRSSPRGWADFPTTDDLPSGPCNVPGHDGADPIDPARAYSRDCTARGQRYARTGSSHAWFEWTSYGYSAAACGVGSKCEQPLLLTTINFDGAGSAIAYDLLRLPGTARFIYLGFVGRTPNPGQIAVRWVAGTALYVLGMREGSAPRQVLLVLIPQSCSHLEQLDWAVLSPWD